MIKLIDVDQVISRATQAYEDNLLRQDIEKAIFGKFLLEETSKLTADAGSSAFFEAEIRAKRRAEVFARVAMSARNARLLIQQLSSFVQEAQTFLTK